MNQSQSPTPLTQFLSRHVYSTLTQAAMVASQVAWLFELSNNNSIRTCDSICQVAPLSGSNGEQIFSARASISVVLNCCMLISTSSVFLHLCSQLWKTEVIFTINMPKTVSDYFCTCNSGWVFSFLLQFKLWSNLPLSQRTKPRITLTSHQGEVLDTDSISSTSRLRAC